MNNHYFNAAMKYGAYLAIILIIIDLLQWATHMVEKMGFTTYIVIGLLTFFILIFLLIYIIKNFRDQFLGGNITFSQAFTIGVLTIIFSSIIRALYSIIFHNWIDPEFSARSIEIMQESMSNFLYNVGAPDDQIDEILSNFEGMEIPTPVQSMINGIKNNIIGGSFLSLIAGAIVKKSKNKSKSKGGFESAMSEIEE